MPVSTLSRLRRVALAGNPNVGKTTVFNLLTGLNQKVANYPGVTVERKSGKLAGSPDVEIVDLPGTYSLNPKSMDERVAYDVLVGRMRGEREPDVVVCVVDATNLERNLYLVSQIMDLGIAVVVALNMMDAAEEEGIEIDVDALSSKLGVPVVPITARKRKGIDDLLDQIQKSDDTRPARKWTLMPAVEPVVQRLSELLREEVNELSPERCFFEALGALTSDPLLAPWKEQAPAFHAAVIEARENLTERKVPFRQAEMLGRYGWISPLISSVVVRGRRGEEQTISDRIDAVLTHRFAGPLIFAGLLLLIFQAIFWWATPLMDGVEAGVAAVGSVARTVLPDGFFEDLIVEGAITGVGNVAVFLPQILLLFFFLGLMEDTGYMARTSFLMDRIMRRMGLSGGSVVPLLSGYACAIPAIMAARTLESERDRLITIMVVPLMSCSARLPIYTLFIAAFIPAGTLFGFIGYQGLAMFSMYLLGTLMAFVAAWVLKTFVFKSDTSMFVMELPPYRAPQLRQVIRRMIDRSKMFVIRAGKIILGMSILLWFLATYPKADLDPTLETERAGVEAAYQARLNSLGEDATVSDETMVTSGAASSVDAVDAAVTWRDEQLAAIEDRAAAAQVRESFIGQFGRALEPIMQPLGFDWKITAGIISSFAAREVIVSSLATIYSVGRAEEGGTLLREALKSDTYLDGTPVFTPLVAVSLMVFFVFALQCVSTLAIARRETGTWFWPAVMWGYMFVLAYIFSFVVYQGGLALGIGV